MGSAVTAKAGAVPAAPILATIEGAERVWACGIVAHDIFGLCRKLLAAGHDPAAPLVSQWHDGRPSIRIASLGAGARLALRDTATDGPRIVKWKPPPDGLSRVGGGAGAREAVPGGAEPPVRNLQP